MSVSKDPIIHSYRQEDIQQILNLAIARHASNDEFSREQLLEIAVELDISPECLQAAERDWLAQKDKLEKRQQFNLYRRSAFQNKLGKYAIANTFLILLNIVSAGTLSWSLYIALFWGLGLAMNAWNLFKSSDEEYEQAFQNWYRKHQLRRSVNYLWDRLNRAWQI